MGAGKDVLLAFHGYANDASLFEPFLKHLENKYTLLSFDLPHHGKSDWADDKIWSKPELNQMLDRLRQEYKTDKFSLLGYSMGGRVCLTIAELVPQCVDKVVLIASDGLAVDYYYYFFTRTLIGKRIFRHMLQNPQGYFKVINWLRDTKRIDASRHRFAMQYLGSEYSRKFLLRAWPAMSGLMPGATVLRRAINKYHIPMAIFMGAYDKIIPPSLAHKFKKGLDSVEVHVLQKGHRVFDNENAGLIAQHLL
jgi:pimeloyl-ACP methyl ester carboxylesterase